MDTVLTPYEAKLIAVLTDRWDPDVLMPVSRDFVKIHNVSEYARNRLTEIAAGYGMSIVFGILNDHHYVEVTRPRK